MVIIGARLASIIGHDRGGRIFLEWAALSIGSQIPKAGPFSFKNPNPKSQWYHKNITLTSLWISCSRDKGSSSSSLIITSALALYLRYFSSGWTPTRNLRSNTCLQKISEFPLKSICLLSFVYFHLFSGWQQLFRPFNIKTSFYALLRASWVYLASDLIYLWSDKVSLILLCIILINWKDKYFAFHCIEQYTVRSYSMTSEANETSFIWIKSRGALCSVSEAVLSNKS